MRYIDDDPPLPPHDGEPEQPRQQWACGPFGFEPSDCLWPLTFPWWDGVSWGYVPG